MEQTGFFIFSSRKSGFWLNGRGSVLGILAEKAVFGLLCYMNDKSSCGRNTYTNRDEPSIPEALLENHLGKQIVEKGTTDNLCCKMCWNYHIRRL
jgi:hypothetical protein